MVPSSVIVVEGRMGKYLTTGGESLPMYLFHWEVGISYLLKKYTSKVFAQERKLSETFLDSGRRGAKASEWSPTSFLGPLLFGAGLEAASLLAAAHEIAEVDEEEEDEEVAFSALAVSRFGVLGLTGWGRFFGTQTILA